jgi:hypothetical protein
VELAFQQEKQDKLVEFTKKNSILIVESEKDIKKAIAASSIVGPLTDHINVSIYTFSFHEPLNKMLFKMKCIIQRRPYKLLTTSKMELQ